MTVALIPIILRLSLRWRSSGTHSTATNLSDGFIVGAWISGIVLISINAWKNTLREHYRNWPASELYYGVPHDQSAHLLYVSWISLYFIYISLWMSKAAFLAFYYSILQDQGKRVKYVLCAASVFTACTFLLHMFLLTFWCHPISGNWNVDGELCSAVHSIQSVTISTFANVGTDLVIISIPISTLIKMRLGRRELSGLAFVFLMGSISIIAALARFVTLELVRKVPRASITHTIGKAWPIPYRSFSACAYAPINRCLGSCRDCLESAGCLPPEPAHVCSATPRFVLSTKFFSS